MTDVDLVILNVILKSRDTPLNEIPESEDEDDKFYCYDATKNQWEYPTTTGYEPVRRSGTQFNAVVIFHSTYSASYSVPVQQIYQKLLNKVLLGLSNAYFITSHLMSKG